LLVPDFSFNSYVVCDSVDIVQIDVWLSYVLLLQRWPYNSYYSYYSYLHPSCRINPDNRILRLGVSSGSTYPFEFHCTEYEYIYRMRGLPRLSSGRCRIWTWKYDGRRTYGLCAWMWVCLDVDVNLNVKCISASVCQVCDRMIRVWQFLAQHISSVRTCYLVSNTECAAIINVLLYVSASNSVCELKINIWLRIEECDCLYANGCVCACACVI
jgi:hypothetical protein